MSHTSSSRFVAKFGGTSMAKPELVIQRMREHSPIAVVVSAPGRDESYPEKMTDLLLAYQNDPTRHRENHIRNRFAAIALRVMNRRDWYAIDDLLHERLQEPAEQSPPRAALGEEFAARMIAQASGRTFIDARDIIFLDEHARPNESLSLSAIEQTCDDTSFYTIPGFYGTGHDGTVSVFERGGSDISGALVAKALAATYQNWSDVDGFYTNNPRTHTDASIIPLLTYDDAQAMANAGCELLHPTVASVLSGTEIITAMASTFSGESKTLIVPSHHVN